MRRALLLAALLCAALAPVAAAKRVRVFAVGPKFNVSWVDTRAHFHDHLLGLVDRRQRTAATDVQPQADDVASHLLQPAARRDLVAFPEDLGLMAIFTGSQGTQARQASDVTTAILDVLAAYAPQTAYYGARFPALTQRGVPTRLLAVAATDTFARVAVETYAEIAARYHVWLEGGIDMAQSWHVVCESRATMPRPPGGVGCDEVNPAKVAALRSPDEPNRTYAYEATTDRASNMALVFDPRGRLVAKEIKTYLTPIELPGQLDLLPGAVFTGVSAVHTPVGTLGFVTSKDAWMPDVTARLDEEHVDLLVQPEFFVGDTVSPTGPWAPDNIQGAGYSDVLRHPSFQALVLPELSGNLFDLSADNQQAIAVKPASRTGPRGHLVGQPDAPGYATIGAWVAPDPDPAHPGEDIAQRRARLGAIGTLLLPGGPGPECPSPAARGACRGGQVEDVIHHDVQVAVRRPLRPVARRKRGPTPFGVSRPLAAAGAAAQRNVALAAHGRLVVAAFEQRQGARDRVLVARSGDGGAHWSRAVPLGSGRHGWWPAAAVGPDGTVWVSWSDDHTGRQRVYVARAHGPSGRFSAPEPADPAVGPAVQQLRPTVAAPGRDRAFVAFADDRARFGADDLPQAGIWAVAVHGRHTQPARRMDSTAAPAALAATLDNAWAPSLAARGRAVELTWIDFRNYEWDVFARASADGGSTWGAEQRVNGTPAGSEALEDTPRAAFTTAGPLIAYTDWASLAGTQRHASGLYDVDVATPGVRPVQADGAGGAHVEAFAPAIAAVGGGAVVAWQDHRHGPGDILAARVMGGRPGRPVRVDDSGRMGWNQWRPAIARSGRWVVAAWEDERDGPTRILFGRAPIRQVG